MSIVSLVRPDGSDPAAQTLAAWADETLNDIRSSVHQLHVDLRGSVRATRLNVENALQNSEAVFFYGEGDWDKLLDGSAALVDTHNIVKAENKIIIVAIACKAAHTLGPAALHASGYLGFNEELGWPPGLSINPFRTACVEGAKQLLLNGADLSQAADAIKKRFADAVHHFKYGPGRNNANAVRAWQWAFWDRGHLIHRGNPSL